MSYFQHLVFVLPYWMTNKNRPTERKTLPKPWPSGFGTQTHAGPLYKSVGHVFSRTRRIYLILICIIISLVTTRRLRANAISDFHGVVFGTILNTRCLIKSMSSYTVSYTFFLTYSLLINENGKIVVTADDTFGIIM